MLILVDLAELACPGVLRNLIYTVRGNTETKKRRRIQEPNGGPSPIP
jgi:hypothetical protein